MLAPACSASDTLLEQVSNFPRLHGRCSGILQVWADCGVNLKEGLSAGPIVPHKLQRSRRF